MPAKLLANEAVPSIVAERLVVWGRCIKKQRLTQKIQAVELCRRVGISDATLRRLERGDAGAGAGTYLSVLLVLGVLDQVAPLPPQLFWSGHAGSRVRKTDAERDDAYF